MRLANKHVKEAIERGGPIVADKQLLKMAVQNNVQIHFRAHTSKKATNHAPRPAPRSGTLRPKNNQVQDHGRHNFAALLFMGERFANHHSL